MKLYAVRIFTLKWDETCLFYSKTLGLPERFRDDEGGWAEYDLGGPCFGVQRVLPSEPEAKTLVGRFVGVSVQVDDVQATYDELLAQGVEFIGEPEQQPWGGTLVELKDPDGNIITLLG